MWEIWKATSGASQYVDRQLSAVEKAKDNVFITRKMVRTFWVLGREVEVGVFVWCHVEYRYYRSSVTGAHAQRHSNTPQLEPQNGSMLNVTVITL